MTDHKVRGLRRLEVFEGGIGYPPGTVFCGMGI
jgi:hypothetical protein